MWVIKVKYGETTRRLVLEEPYTFERLCSLVRTRFELSNADFERASLRYIDTDNDEICVNSEEEFAEALSLLKNVDPPVLKMTLMIADVQTATSSWAVSLNAAAAPANEANSDDSDSVVVVEQEEEGLRAKEEERLRQEELEEQALAQKLEEENRIAAEAAELKRIEEEKGAKAVAEAEERRKRMEEEEARLKAEEEEKLAAAAIKAEQERREAEAAAAEEERQRLIGMQVALSKAEDDAIRCIAALVEMGCNTEQLTSIFSTRVVDMQRREAVASGEDVHEVEKVECDMHVAAVVMEEIMAEVDQAADAAQVAAVPEVQSSLVPSLLGGSEYMPEEPVPAPAVQPPPAVDEPASAPLPLQIEALAPLPPPPQPPAQVQGFEFDDQSRDLAMRLGAFYVEHNPRGLDRVPQLVQDFHGKVDSLNVLLKTKYGKDLNSVVLDAPVVEAEPEPVEEVAAQEVVEQPAEQAVEQVEAQEEVECEELVKLREFGFVDKELNLQLLQKHDYDVTKVVDELLGA